MTADDSINMGTVMRRLRADARDLRAALLRAELRTLRAALAGRPATP